jgi:hypothetical protein
MFLKGVFSSVSYIRINPQMKLMTEQDRGCIRCLSRFIKSDDVGETYKTVKQNEASMKDESHLIRSRRK